jgi:hypothetical protein
MTTSGADRIAQAIIHAIREIRVQQFVDPGSGTEWGRKGD